MIVYDGHWIRVGVVVFVACPIKTGLLCIFIWAIGHCWEVLRAAIISLTEEVILFI
jgi:hypothetical protein